MLATLKDQVAQLNEFMNKVDSMDETDFVKKSIKQGISKVRKGIKEELYILEQRENAKLRTVDINGQTIEIPRAMSFRLEDYDWQVIDGVIYATSKSKFDKDGSFHFWTYVWLKNGYKFTRLTVSILGNDRYGDRMYCNTEHYRDERDQSCYSNRNRINCKGQYKDYIQTVIQLVRQYEGFEKFFENGRFI